MKKVKLIIAAVAVLGLVSSSPVYADSYAPGEGTYLGVFVGHGAGHVDAKVVASNWNSKTLGDTETQTSEIKDGGLGLSGIEGGGWLGYGYKMGDLYIGFEMDGAAGGGKFEIASDVALTTTTNGVESLNLSKVAAEMKWSAGAAGRIGYYVNKDTLFALKAGISAAEFDVTWADQSEDYYGGGPRFGASIESRLSAIDPNLSVRLAANYVDYLTADISSIGSIDQSTASGGGVTSTDSEVSGAAYNMRLGVQYSFFDVNSLF